MTLDEFKQRYAEEQAKNAALADAAEKALQSKLRYPSCTITRSEDVDDDDYDEDIERRLLVAQSLLYNAMQHLGFYGDRKLSRELTRSDRAIMLRCADEIKEFLDELEDAGLSADNVND